MGCGQSLKISGRLTRKRSVNIRPNAAVARTWTLTYILTGAVSLGFPFASPAAEVAGWGEVNPRLHQRRSWEESLCPHRLARGEKNGPAKANFSIDPDIAFKVVDLIWHSRKGPRASFVVPPSRCVWQLLPLLGASSSLFFWLHSFVARGETCMHSRIK